MNNNIKLVYWITHHRGKCRLYTDTSTQTINKTVITDFFAQYLLLKLVRGLEWRDRTGVGQSDAGTATFVDGSVRKKNSQRKLLTWFLWSFVKILQQLQRSAENVSVQHRWIEKR